MARSPLKDRLAQSYSQDKIIALGLEKFIQGKIKTFMILCELNKTNHILAVHNKLMITIEHRNEL